MWKCNLKSLSHLVLFRFNHLKCVYVTTFWHSGGGRVSSFFSKLNEASFVTYPVLLSLMGKQSFVAYSCNDLACRQGSWVCFTDSMQEKPVCAVLTRQMTFVYEQNVYCHINASSISRYLAHIVTLITAACYPRCPLHLQVSSENVSWAKYVEFKVNHAFGFSKPKWQFLIT